MPQVPSDYCELIELILTPLQAADQFRRGRTWGDYLRLARCLANAIAVLHGKGLTHSDIQYRNFLANLTAAHAVMIDLDGLVVPGFLPPQVAGMVEFMAPEILTSHTPQTPRTDCHSLAVLILHTLLFRNVMTPLKDYCDDDPDRSNRLGYGQHALFSEDPNDRRHRPTNLGLPLFRRGTLSYRMLTPALQHLTELVFIQGLRDPQKRPLAREWDEALSWALNELWMCTRCRQYFPYPYWLVPVARRMCPFCGERIKPPYPVVIELYEERRKHTYLSLGRRVVLGHNFRVFLDMVQQGRRPPPSRRSEPFVGHVELDTSSSQHRLINDAGGTWIASLPDGRSRHTAGKGQSITLLKDHCISFGEGYRLIRVVEAP
jgi:DNA-binding helix-hairpin-helix protein with protein kinase domain